MARRALGPATLAVVQAVRGCWPTDGEVVVACSGGTDSMALAAAAVHVGRTTGRPVRAVVIDHGLQEGSDDVARTVAGRLRALGMDAAVVPVRVEATGAGMEADARGVRYRALEEAAGEGTVLLGHTLDDQAETVLLGLARGSGIRSLAGMPARRGRFVRPLLGLRREVTRACAVELGLEVVDDPHNEDPSFARVRVRTTVLPTLERELGPGIAEALARTAVLARADAAALDALAARVWGRAESEDTLPVALLADLEPAVRGRVVRSWLASRGARDVSADHVSAVLSLVDGWHGQKAVDVPGARVVRRADRLATL